MTTKNENPKKEWTEITESELAQALSEEADVERLQVLQDELEGKSWTDLEVKEHAGYLLFADKIWRRNKAGKFEARTVMIRVPRSHEMRKARAEAHRIAKLDGIDPKVDPVQFDNLENYCIMQVAIRNDTAPFEPLYTSVADLEKNVDEGSLELIWAKLGAYKRKLNPRPGKLSRAHFIAMIASIAERREIDPLVVTDGATQSAFIVTTASLLHSLMMTPSTSQSFETSTPASLASGPSTSSPAAGADSSAEHPTGS
jgi:hypothetical protein